jgi:uncharacterized protein YbjT (DUF2867 family)
MKITMLGSAGNINRIAIPQLIEAGHEVTAITSHKSRTSAIEALGAKPAVGSMNDLTFLTNQFANQDVVYLMISGASTDLFASAQKQAEIFKEAILQSGTKKIVNLSSVGAQDDRSGTLYAYHFIEDALTSLSDVDVAFVRPVGFYNNLYANLDSIKTSQAIYSNIAAATERKYVDPADIADVVAQVLVNIPSGKTIRYVVSDTFTGKEMAAAFSKALSLQIKYVEITDDQYADALRDNGVPDSIVIPFVKSSDLQKQPTQMYADLKNHKIHNGKIKLADFAKKFAQAYHAGGSAPQAQTVISK